MAKAFTDSLTRENEIRETLDLILAETDPGYMNSVPLGQFTQDLIDEVRFLLPGDEEDMQHVEQYVRAHSEELYQRSLSSFAQGRATAPATPPVTA
jgi:hypothetical protein